MIIQYLPIIIHLILLEKKYIKGNREQIKKALENTNLSEEQKSYLQKMINKNNSNYLETELDNAIKLRVGQRNILDDNNNININGNVISPEDHIEEEQGEEQEEEEEQEEQEINNNNFHQQNMNMNINSENFSHSGGQIPPGQFKERVGLGNIIAQLPQTQRFKIETYEPIEPGEKNGYENNNNNEVNENNDFVDEDEEKKKMMMKEIIKKIYILK